jgi:hypothetical protein
MTLPFEERLHAARQAAVMLRQAADWQAAQLSGKAAQMVQEHGATGQVQVRDPFRDSIALFADTVLGMIEELRQCQSQPNPPAETAPTPKRSKKTSRR